MCDGGKGQAAQKLTWSGAECFHCAVLDSLDIQSPGFRFCSVSVDNKYHSNKSKLQLSYSDFYTDIFKLCCFLFFPLQNLLLLTGFIRDAGPQSSISVALLGNSHFEQFKEF